MAAHKPKFGPVETELYAKLFSPDVMRQHIPGMAEVLDGAKHLRAMNEEIGVLGKFHQNVAGWTEGRTAHRVAKIDTEIMEMLNELHAASCTCGREIWGADGHKAWFYAWLELPGPKEAFDVRGKVSIAR